ncbi:hypothetical protein ACINK0_11315 [Deinococcus sp. VB343]|uniref:hypothetical protein n=1 Tax=Deinococcus sp. VB343 TaxID=3385567 RepID=UPI0039C980D6
MARAKQTIADDITAAGGTPPTDLNAVSAQDLEDQLAGLRATQDKVASGELTPEQAKALAGFSEADDDGNRWKIEPEGKQVRVYLLDKHGRGYDALVGDAEAGKTFLKGYAAKQ